MAENSVTDRGAPRFFLRKEERLRSKKQIEKLFSEGEILNVYPLKIIYLYSEYSENLPARAAFAVSKRLFKRAVDRNLIKRRMREAYRLNRHILAAAAKPWKKDIFFIYTGKEISDFYSIQKAMKRSLCHLSKITVRNP